MLDLLVAGDCNPDLVLMGGDVVPEFGQREKLVDSATLTVGGSGAITACGAARLGLRTAFAGAVGRDMFGSFMLDALAERGVDTSACIVDAAWATGITVALASGGDRAILTAPGAIPALTAAHLDHRLVASARHLHVASYFLLDGLRPSLPELVSAAHAAGVTVSLDPQGDPSGSWDSGLSALTPQLDVLFVNEQEDAAIDSHGCPLVVVKQGSHGALARSPTGIARHAGLAVDVVDTTGAGDSFDAGFLAGWLAGQAVEEALALGCACGALSTRGVGGVAAQPTLEEARRALG